MWDPIEWIGASGARYTYYVHEMDFSFLEGHMGNYMYVRLEGENRWVPIFIGYGDLGKDLGPNHPKISCIMARGATHFHTHMTDSPRLAEREKQDLLSQYPEAFDPHGCNERILPASAEVTSTQLPSTWMLDISYGDVLRS